MKFNFDIEACDKILKALGIDTQEHAITSATLYLEPHQPPRLSVDYLVSADETTQLINTIENFIIGARK